VASPETEEKTDAAVITSPALSSPLTEEKTDAAARPTVFMGFA
jgi:hypothetical protein